MWQFLVGLTLFNLFSQNSNDELEKHSLEHIYILATAGPLGWAFSWPAKNIPLS